MAGVQRVLVEVENQVFLVEKCLKSLLLHLLVSLTDRIFDHIPLKESNILGSLKLD